MASLNYWPKIINTNNQTEKGFSVLKTKKYVRNKEMATKSQ
jgi:hypothetical protein